MNEDLKVLIAAGEKKLQEMTWKQKRQEARENESRERLKKVIRGMYPKIAQYIYCGEQVDIWRENRYQFIVEAPDCVVLFVSIFIGENGAFLTRDPNEEIPAFYSSNPYSIATDDLDVALALAHKAWCEETGNESIYVPLQEGA